VDERDLRFEVHTSGEHVTVRVKHEPTGLVGEATSSTLGQHRVKQHALALLTRKVTRRCPCGHPVDSEGTPDEYTCLNGHIYGPCGNGNCYGSCDDTAGTCKSLDDCCDPRLED
jgi:hypothetical protein